MSLPVLSVEGQDLPAPYRICIEATAIHAEAIRVGSRNVEGLDPAVFAEGVLSDTGMEPIGGQVVRTRLEMESRALDREVQIADALTDRAVALVEQ